LTVKPNLALRRKTRQTIILLSGLLLLAAVGLAGCDSGDAAKYRAAQIQLRAFSEALKMFWFSCGRFPSTEEGLAALVACPTNIPASQWSRRLDKIPPDPWGHLYVYRCPGLHNSKSFDIFSCGADGITKSAGEDLDDINNWDTSSPRNPNYDLSRHWFQWLGGVFVFSLVVLLYCWRFSKSKGNLHGVGAVCLVLAVLAVGSALYSLHLPELAAKGLAYCLLFCLLIAAGLAASGMLRGCRISRICGWFLLLLLLLFVLLKLSGCSVIKLAGT
jgi:general secretion pathway protein G